MKPCKTQYGRFTPREEFGAGSRFDDHIFKKEEKEGRKKGSIDIEFEVAGGRERSGPSEGRDRRNYKKGRRPEVPSIHRSRVKGPETTPNQTSSTVKVPLRPLGTSMTRSLKEKTNQQIDL